MKEVSVIIPCWNREKFITRAIKSVLAQRYSHPLEILVIDDASDDNSWTEIEALADQHDEVIAIKMATRLGNPGEVRNIGLDESRYDHIAYLDSDDIWLPHHLLTAQAYFAPEVSMVSNYWGFAIFDKNTKVRKFVPTDHIDAVNTNCRVHTRECLSLGMFNEKRWGEDYDFFSRIEKHRTCVRTKVLTSINGYIDDGNNLTYEFVGKHRLKDILK